MIRFRVEVDGDATLDPVECDIDGPGASCSDLINTLCFEVGQLISIEADPDGTVDNNPEMHWTAKFLPGECLEPPPP
jgi:hypothetical protein